MTNYFMQMIKVEEFIRLLTDERLALSQKPLLKYVPETREFHVLPVYPIANKDCKCHFIILTQ